MYRSHKDIIDAWPGGLPSFAEDHGVKYDTAKGWRRRNSIPPERWFETIEMAKEKDVPGVTHEVLHALRTVGKYQRGAADRAEVAA